PAQLALRPLPRRGCSTDRGRLSSRVEREKWGGRAWLWGVGQDSNLVVYRILNDRMRIVSRDPTQARLCHRLAALASIAPIRLHLEYPVLDPRNWVRSA